MKIILLTLLLFLLPFVNSYEYEQSYSTNVVVHIDTGENKVNITLEGQTNIYSITNSTNSYTLNFKRNVSCVNSSNTTNVVNYYTTNTYQSNSNVSEPLNTMTSTCQKIADAYGDASSYYKPLLECTASKSQCEKDRDIGKVNSDKFISLEPTYNTCLNEKKNVESQLTSCSTNLNQITSEKTAKESELSQAKSNSSMYGWGLLILAIIIGGYFYSKTKKTAKHPLEGMPPS